MDSCKAHGQHLLPMTWPHTVLCYMALVNMNLKHAVLQHQVENNLLAGSGCRGAAEAYQHMACWCDVDTTTLIPQQRVLME
jgi:hypothetical protein